MLAAKWEVPEERHVSIQAGKWTLKHLLSLGKEFMHILKASSMGDTAS